MRETLFSGRLSHSLTEEKAALICSFPCKEVPIPGRTGDVRINVGIGTLNAPDLLKLMTTFFQINTMEMNEWGIKTGVFRRLSLVIFLPKHWTLNPAEVTEELRALNTSQDCSAPYRVKL